VLARETDPHDVVRSEAAAMLKTPAQQAVLDRDPAWVEKVLALTHVHLLVGAQKEQQVRKQSRTADSILVTGGIISLLGLVALILPLSGHYVTYFDISLKDPLWNIVILAAGLGLIAWGISKKRQA
jgi:hypothetical protein